MRLGRITFGLMVCAGFLCPPLSFSQSAKLSAGDSASFKEKSTGPSALKSSGSGDREYLPKWYDTFVRIPGDWVEFSRQTFRPQSVPLIAGVAGATAALVVLDRQWWWTEKKWYEKSPNVRGFSDWMNYTFDGTIEIGIVGGFAVYGVAAWDKRALRTASQATEAILACGAVVQLLKYATGRESPLYTTSRTGRWDFFPDRREYTENVQRFDAFPSGHLSTAMAVLTVISENYPEATWLRPGGYIILAGVASSLVACSVHWWSDYPLAIALGYTFGQIAAHPVGTVLAEKKGGTDAKISLVPVAVPGGAGVGVAVSLW